MYNCDCRETDMNKHFVLFFYTKFKLRLQTMINVQ